MEFVFSRVPSNLQILGADIFDDVIARPSAKTTCHNSNLPKAGQELHALQVPIRARVNIVRESRVRA